LILSSTGRKRLYLGMRNEREIYDRLSVSSLPLLSCSCCTTQYKPSCSYHISHCSDHAA
jgi:hypothetical protein